ncbi:Pumilio y domain family member 6 [Wickerhamiella sorbophila]|uniref:Pumilio y domain family member 6 n=1 Tax=Wickerhamiella sorbophila TaxID=45607 RepID=A0A2T0FGY1_9ASCO|nr:Pumilio y domain family member 6 [Wickerhamiella sorbophila]PRT54244.1 Pumilio y domain family member 6 [Wickerhamiella sorbophila]
MSKRKNELKQALPAKKVKKQEEEPDMSSEEEIDMSDADSRLSQDSSADELDESQDELDESENEDQESSSETNGKTEEEVAQSKEKRKEQKQLRQERKLKKAHGQEIQEIKIVWERLRAKTLPAETRKKLVQQAFDLCKDRFKELVLRHDSSRVVQTIFKYADQEKRTFITNALKGSYVELAKSAYGKYLLVKMMHYGNAKVRKQIIDELHGNFRKLIKHREGAYVIEDCFRDYSTAAQRRQILREFYGGEFALVRDAGKDKANLAEIIAEKPDKRPFLLENLNQVITAAVNKGSIGFEIIHAAMLEYVRNINPEGSDRETFVDLITEQFAEFVHTSDGSHVAMLVLALASAKERKKLLRALKPFGDKLATDQYGNLVLTTIFSTVDDTVFVGKSFMPIFEDQILDLIVHKYGRRPLLYLLTGRSPRYFSKDILERFDEVDALKSATSKKDDETRRLELLKQFAPLMYRTVADSASELMKDPLGMQFIGELLEHGCEDENRTAAIDAVVREFSGSVELVKAHPLANPVCSRTLKTLVKQVPEVREQVTELALKNTEEWAAGPGTFVIVALLESLEDPKELKKAVSKHRMAIKASEARGKDLLLEVLQS